MLSDLEQQYGYENIPRAFSKLSLLIILGLFIYLLVLNIQIMIRNRDLNADIRVLQGSLKKEQMTNKELKSSLVMYGDSISVEILAREKLGLIKKGETAFRIY